MTLELFNSSYEDEKMVAVAMFAVILDRVQAVRQARIIRRRPHPFTCVDGNYYPIHALRYLLAKAPPVVYPRGPGIHHYHGIRRYSVSETFRGA